MPVIVIMFANCIFILLEAALLIKNDGDNAGRKYKQYLCMKG
jgi:hypothetical protein